MAVLKDSGFREKFPSGAVRDTAEGKGRMDLIDFDCAAEMLDDDPVLFKIGAFITSKDINNLRSAIRILAIKCFGDMPTAIIEVSKQFEDGAKKYAPNNWRRGMPLHRFFDSGSRHYMQYLRGDKDEPHDRAALWNLMCARWTFVNRPDMDDIDETYAGKWVTTNE